MAKSKETVERCDAPGCEYFELVTPGEPVTGYHLGKGFWVQGGGGPIPAFYAHDDACIVPAMHAVIDRALR